MGRVGIGTTAEATGRSRRAAVWTGLAVAASNRPEKGAVFTVRLPRQPNA